MACCFSCGSVHLPTARLVVFQEDARGLIQEFPEPMKVGEILRERPGFFVCHADSMRYDEYVSPLSAEQELQVEQLYFLLPVNKLRQPLPASDMAALAVKASAAMERSQRCRNKLGQRRCKITPSLMMMEQDVDDINHHKIISSASRRGEMKREGYDDSEMLERREGAEAGLRARPVHFNKLQRVASSGRKWVNGAPLRKKLSTIHEEAFT